MSVLLSSVPAALSQAWTTHRQDKRHSLSEGHYRSEVVPWLMAQHEWAESTWHGRIPAFADRSVELAECLYFLYTIDPNLADRKRLRLEKQFSIRSPIPHSLMLKITGDGFQVETWKNWDQRWAAHEGRRDELDPSFERNHRYSAIMRMYSMPRQVIDCRWNHPVGLERRRAREWLQRHVDSFPGVHGRTADRRMPDRKNAVRHNLLQRARALLEL